MLGEKVNYHVHHSCIYFLLTHSFLIEFPGFQSIRTITEVLVYYHSSAFINELLSSLSDFSVLVNFKSGLRD